MATTYVARPNGDVYSNYNNLVGASTRWQAQSDQSDSSWVQHYTGGVYPTTSETKQTLNTSAVAGIPSTEVIRRLRIVCRYWTGGNNTNTTFFWTLIDQYTGTPTVADFFTHNQNGIATTYGMWREKDQYDAFWTPVKVANQLLRLYDTDQGSTKPAVADAWIELETSPLPTVAVTSPGTLDTTTQPTISFTYSHGDAASMTAYQAYIVDLTTGLTVWSSGTVNAGVGNGGSTSFTVGTPLENKRNFRVYVRATNDYVHGSWGAWSSADFATLITYPAVPEIVATLNPSGIPSINVDLLGYDNLLTAQAATFDDASGGTGSWAIGYGGSSVARSTSQYFSGSASLALTCNASAYAMAVSPAFVTKAGQWYAAVMQVRSAATARQVKTRIDFYEGGGSFVASSPESTLTLTTTTGWTKLDVRALAPTNAATAVLCITFMSTAASEVHYIDAIRVCQNTVNQVDNPVGAEDANADNTPDGFSLTGTVTASTIIDNGTLTTDTKVFAGDRYRTLAIAAGNNGGGTAGISKTVTLLPATTYVFSVFARLRSGSALGGSESLTLTLSGISNNGSTPVAINATNHKQWVELVYVGTTSGSAGSTIQTATMALKTNLNVAGNLDIGAFHVERASARTAFTDLTGPFSRGGTLPTQRLEVQRSIDGGATWVTLTRPKPDGFTTTLPNTSPPDETQYLTFDDYEVPRNKDARYRVRSVAAINGVTMYSLWSRQVAVSKATTFSGWWLKPINSPSMAVQLSIAERTFAVDRPMDMGVFDPLDADETVVVYGRKRGHRIKFTALFWTPSAWDAFKAVRELADTCLLQASDGRQWYIRLGDKANAPEVKYNEGEIERRVAIDAIEVAA